MGDEVGGKMKRTSSTICIKKLIQAKKLLADLTTVNRQNLIVTRNTDHVKENQKKIFKRANLRSDEIEAVLLGAAIANIPLVGTQLYIIINDDHPTLALVNNFQESKWQAIIAGMLIAYGSGKVWNFLLGGETMTVDIDERNWKQRLLGTESKRTGPTQQRVVPYKAGPGIIGKLEREYKARSALGRVGAWLFGGFWAMAIISAGDYYLREFHDFSMDEAAADYLQRRAKIHPLMNI